MLPTTPRVMTDVLLIRHALCDPVGRAIAGRTPGINLNSTGTRQAEALAEGLVGIPMAALYCSPLERARETAAALERPLGIPARIAPGLIELDFGSWTGRTLDSLAGDPVWSRFNTERATTRIPGGETMDEVVARGAGELARMAADHPGLRVAAVTHADVIRALLTHYAGMPLDRMLRLEVAPASVSVVRIGPEPRVLAVNWRADGLGDFDFQSDKVQDAGASRRQE